MGRNIRCPTKGIFQLFLRVVIELKYIPDPTYLFDAKLVILVRDSFEPVPLFFVRRLFPIVVSEGHMCKKKVFEFLYSGLLAEFFDEL